MANAPIDDARSTAITKIGDRQIIDLSTRGKLKTHETNESNPHKVTKSQVGLGNVRNQEVYHNASGGSSVSKEETLTYITDKTSSVKYTIPQGTYSKPSGGIPASDLAESYKTTQTAVSDPSASGDSNTFIASISQNTNGVITPTKKTLSAATTSAIGGIKLGYTQSDKKYPVELDENSKAYVNVPWADNNTTYNTGTASASGLTKLYTGIGSNEDGTITQKAITTELNGKLSTSLKGAKSGLAELDGNGKVPSSQLPSYVDDVIEASSLSNFPTTGESGKIYVATDTNKTYRWSGSSYVEISASLAIGTTSSTAAAGNHNHSGVYKTVQTAVSDPSASGTSITFIDSISQNTNGVITPTKKTVSDMQGATSSAAGVHGLVPAPASGKQASFLRGDGTWVVPTNTTYSNATTSTAGLMSSTDKSKLDGIATGANNYTLPATSSDTLGGIKIGYTQSGKNYPVALDSNNKAYVNVPWTTPAATSDTLGGIKIGYTQSGKNYPVVLDTNSKAYVNVPWTDTDTHYTNTLKIQAAGTDAVSFAQNANKTLNIKGSGSTTVSKTADGEITISSTDTNTTYSTGTASASGLTKLYTVTGSNTDGTITQKAITTALGGKADVVTATTAGSGMVWNGTSWIAQDGYGYEIQKTDYLYQNKTLNNFMKSTVGEVYIVSNQTPIMTGIIIGQSYTVTWGGTNYTCTAFDINQTGHAGLGNAAFIGGNDTNEPFLYISEMVVGTDTTVDTWGKSTSSDVTISVHGLANFVYQSDIKFAPNSNVRNGSCSLSVEEGSNTTASGYASHAEGYNTNASAFTAHAEGDDTTASGNSSHAEGLSTTASGRYSHAEGYSTTASGSSAHAEGDVTTASGDYSHTEGAFTTASADYSHAEGCGTTAAYNYQHVQGKYNVVNSSSTYADIVGWGVDANTRRNISALTTTGDLRLKGSVYVNCNYDSTGGSELSTKTYVDTKQAKHVTVTATLSSNSWSNKSQTVSVSGITASNTIIVGPAPSSVDEYGNAGIICTTQASGSLTFTCNIVPTTNITVNVIILN